MRVLCENRITLPFGIFLENRFKIFDRIRAYRSKHNSIRHDFLISDGILVVFAQKLVNFS